MKILSLLALVSLSTQAEVVIPVVKNYDLAANQSIWNKVKTDKLPESLISDVSVADPNNPYSKAFPKTFLQNSKFLVCYDDCDKDSFSGVKGGALNYNKLQEWSAIEQANVYYWLERYYSFLEERFNFSTKDFLKVYTNRKVKNESNKKMNTNAFYLPTDNSLNFLPASKNPLMKVLTGKLSRSGFDPSIIIHEASHFYFNQLFDNAINAEIGGLNEGFADYMANIMLENPKIGLVMFQGKSIRDTSNMMREGGSFKVYSPKLEVHAQGEVIAYILWETRKSASSPEEFDRLVISAIKDISQNPYSSIHDFKEAMITKIKTILSGTELIKVLENWENTIPGQANKLLNKDFVDTQITSEKIGFEVSQVLNDSLSEAFAIDKESKINLEVGTSVDLSENQIATLITHHGTDLWVVVDKERSNIIGVYAIDGALINEKAEVKELDEVLRYLVDFSVKVGHFKTNLQSIKDLLDGNGVYSLGFKVKKVQEREQMRTINEETFTSKTIHLQLSQKLIHGLTGLPSLSEIEFYTAPSSLTNLELPSYNNEKIIGYRFKTKAGMVSSMIINKSTK